MQRQLNPTFQELIEVLPNINRQIHQKEKIHFDRFKLTIQQCQGTIPNNQKQQTFSHFLFQKESLIRLGIINHLQGYSQKLSNNLLRPIQKCISTSYPFLFFKYITPKGFTQILPLLERSNTLVNLNISYNHLSTIGSWHLCKLIKKGLLQYLNIYATQINQGIEHFADTIADSNLLSLNIGYNDLNNSGLKKIISHFCLNTQLLDLNLQKSFISDLTELGNLLYVVNLNILDLTDNELIAEQVNKLYFPLIHQNQMRKLFLSRNPIGDNLSGIEKLLSQCHQLYELHLQNCSLGFYAVELISKGLEKNKNLRILDLSSNSIKSRGAYFLKEGLKQNKGLKILDISHCSIKDEGCKLLLDELQTSLQKLMIKDNSISDECKNVLQDFVLNNKNLVYLDFSSNLLGYKLEMFLNIALSENTKLYKQSKVPKYLLKLRVYNSIILFFIKLKEALSSQKDQTIKQEEEIKQRQLIAEQSFQSLRQKYQAKQKDEIQQSLDLKNELMTNEEQLANLQQEAEIQEIDFYKWQKEAEANIGFYERNIQQEKNMVIQFQTSKKQLLSKLEGEDRQYRIKINELQEQFREAKRVYDQKLTELQNIQCDILMAQQKKQENPNKQNFRRRASTIGIKARGSIIARKSISLMRKKA